MNSHRSIFPLSVSSQSSALGREDDDEVAAAAAVDYDEHGGLVRELYGRKAVQLKWESHSGLLRRS